MLKSKYCLKHPYVGKIERITRLNKQGSTKNNHHVTICIEDSDIQYQVGSSFGLLPDNPENEVNAILSILDQDPKTTFHSKKMEQIVSINTFLAQNINIFRIPKKLAQYLLPFQKDNTLANILTDDWKGFCEKNTLSMFLKQFYRKCGSIEELLNLFSPMLPRFYSVASSQNVVGNKVELLVADFSYQVANHNFRSITTNHLLNKESIRLFCQDNHSFSLPCANTPIIMVGPGTGIAAFKGFIQDRIDHQNTANNILFTGDRHKKYDFYYEEEFLTYQKNGFLEIHTAFSRDSTEKVYVQHKIWEQRKTIYDLLMNQKAKLYISGDAKKMAKDVMNTITKIIQIEKNIDLESASLLVRNLKKNKQILLDVY